MKEIWKLHPTWTNYEISNYGKVRNKTTQQTLNGTKNGNGYIRIHVIDIVNNIRKHEFLHKLVLETFIGPRPKGKIIRYYPDQDPSNNRLDNLSYNTSQQNNYDRIENDTYNQAKLTPEMVLEIKEYIKQGISGKLLSEEYKISRAIISNIGNNNIWKNIGDDVSFYYNNTQPIILDDYIIDFINNK